MKHIYTGTIKVRKSDLDEFCMVSPASYLIYMEEIRREWINSLGIKLKENISISQLNINYLRPILFPSTATVELYCGLPKEKSWEWYHRILNQKLCAEAWITACCLDPTTGKKIIIPDEFRQILF